MYLHGLRGWRPLTADRNCACGCLAVTLARVCGFSLQPIGCTSALACDVQRYCSCSCRLSRYISVMPFTFLLPVYCPFQLRSVTDEQHVRIIMWFSRPSPLSHFVVGPRTHISSVGCFVSWPGDEWVVKGGTSETCKTTNLMFDSIYI